MVFKVKDTGVGIAPKTLANLFQPFVQANRDDRGTGLGLSENFVVVKILDFVRQFAELMGGYAFAKSKGLGHGSSFTVCVPHIVVQAPTQVDDELIISQAPQLSKPTKEIVPEQTEIKIVSDIVKRKILVAEVTQK